MISKNQEKAEVRTGFALSLLALFVVFVLNLFKPSTVHRIDHVIIYGPNYGARWWSASFTSTCSLSHVSVWCRTALVDVSHSFLVLTLLQFVKIVVSLLLLTTLTIFVAGIARIHMAILSFLSAGLLLSLSLFEKEYKKVVASREDEPGAAPVSSSDSKEEKTD